jgi:hypothetical protein
MAKGDGLPAQFAMQLAGFTPQMQRWNDHAMPMAHAARGGIGRRDGPGMAVHDHDAPRADFDEGFGHFLDHRGQCCDRKRDAARDTGEEILATKGNGRRHQRIRALGVSGSGNAAGDIFRHQVIAHRQGWAMGFKAAHRQDRHGPCGEARSDFWRGQFRDAMRAHASKSKRGA